MKIKTNPITLGSKGYYDLNVYKANGEEVVEKRITGSKNVVTYEGAYKIFFQSGPYAGGYYAKVGTGVSELTRSSLNLGNPDSANTTTISSLPRPGTEVDNLDGTSTLTISRTMSFSLGQVVGTFSEVGIFNSGILVAGQLIKDAMGNPTTVTVLADEQLTITYTLELTVPNGGLSVQPVSGTGTVTTPEGTSNWTAYSQPFFRRYPINNSDTNERMDAHGSVIGYYDSSGSRITQANSGVPQGSLSHNGSGVVTQATSAYVAPPSLFESNDIKYILYSGYFTQASIDTSGKRENEGGNNQGSLIVEFSPALVKDSTRSLKAEFELTWNI